MLIAENDSLDAVNGALRSLNYNSSSTWAWANFLPTVKKIIEINQFRSVMEIGGGRFPSLTKNEVDALGIQYTSNDISARELSLSPDWISKAHFDIQTTDQTILKPFEGKYDLIYSKMVMEHLPRHRDAYRNIAKLLAPGGMAIAFHPTLFAFPFIANYLLPEAFSRRLVALIFPNRTDDGIPKFPAYYGGCRIAEGVRKDISKLGFSEVRQIPFYHHTYYSKFPIIRELHHSFSKFVAARNFTPIATFSYTIARK